MVAKQITCVFNGLQEWLWKLNTVKIRGITIEAIKNQNQKQSVKTFCEMFAIWERGKLTYFSIFTAARKYPMKDML